jgi:hypothetical protein
MDALGRQKMRRNAVKPGAKGLPDLLLVYLHRIVYNVLPEWLMVYWTLLINR